jgi:hypothetical protein
VFLKEDGWLNEDDDPASSSEMKAVLSDLSQLRIVNDNYYVSNDVGAGLDNVVLEQ